MAACKLRNENLGERVQKLAVHSSNSFSRSVSYFRLARLNGSGQNKNEKRKIEETNRPSCHSMREHFSAWRE